MENQNNETDVVVKKSSKSRKNNNSNNMAVVFVVSMLLSFVFGVFGAYIYSSMAPVKESIVKNITTSELVENSISSSVDKVYYRTVVIIASLKGKEISTGTGFIYKIEKNKAYIMTNNHVIEGADEAKIQFNDDDKEYKVNIVGGDIYSDIAVLTLNTGDVDRKLEAVEIGNSTEMNRGDTIFTVGAPMGVSYKGTVTKGIVSGLDRLVEVSSQKNSLSDYIIKVLQIDAAVNPGNSGGPLSDVSGNVIGIISLKIVQDEVEGMGFAIPIEDALEYANMLETGKQIERPFVGVSMTELPDEYYARKYNVIVPDDLYGGVWIKEVTKGSPASQAGLQMNDLIFKINDKKVNSVSEFRYELYKFKIGEKIQISYYRDGKPYTTYLTLGKN